MRLGRIWLVCLAVVSLGIAIFAGVDLQQYLWGGGASADSFQRVFYTVITSTDFPMIAVWVGSVINVVCCRWLFGSSTDQAQDPIPAAAESETFTLAG